MLILPVFLFCETSGTSWILATCLSTSAHSKTSNDVIFKEDGAFSAACLPEQIKALLFLHSITASVLAADSIADDSRM